MNKKILFTAAAIPVALIVPTVAGAAGANTVTVTGQNIVNETLKASIENLPANSIVKGYQWYYVDGSSDSTKKPISGATSATFTIPVEAAGKTVFVEATTTKDEKYKSEPRSIKELQLSITAPRIDSSSNYAVPGELVQVSGAIVTDDAGAKLKNSQITYSYQWFYKVGESFTIIDGAANDTYRIPQDALEKGMKDIIVKVKAKVGSSLVESDVSAVISVSNEPSDSMIDEIKTLLKTDNKYNVTSLESFKAKVTELENKYQALSTAAKANVTNYDVLKRAAADVDLISKLNEKVDKVNEVNEKDLCQNI